MTKIAWLSDFDIIGSGYLNISIPLCVGLANAGYDVKAIGIGYQGQEHFFPFSIIPARSFQAVDAILKNLNTLWQFDVLVTAFDLYIHESVMRSFNERKFKYIGVFPIEAEPLCMTWAGIALMMDKQLVISQFGTDAMHEVGIQTAEHLQVGIDTNAWKMPTEEERNAARRSLLGIEDDTFVVLTVADNQERKNLAEGMEIFKEFSQSLNGGRKAIYVVVTRENNMVGWKLRDYAQEIGISKQFMIYERGLPFPQLWMLYAGADAFLLPSKAEGLGMPLLEAMSVGIPCVATDCTGMRELLSDNRGILIPAVQTHRDPFGNGRRYWINTHLASDALYKIADGKLPDIKGARAYTETRVWEKSILHLDNVIKQLQENK